MNLLTLGNQLVRIRDTNKFFLVVRGKFKNLCQVGLKRSILMNQKKITIISIEFKHLEDYYQKKNKKELMKVTNN